MRERERFLKVICIIIFASLVFPLSLFAMITFERTYGGPSIDFAYSVRQTQDEGYIFTGTTREGSFQDFDVYLVKTDSFGDTLWIKSYSYNDSAWDNGLSVRETSDGGYIIAGQTGFTITGICDVYLVKTDSLGDTLWTRTYGGALDDKGYSVQQTNDNGYIIAGCTESFGAGGYDVYLLKVDSLGDTLWTRTYGGANDDFGMSVQVAPDNGYIIAGYTNSFGSGGRDVYLIKTDSLGDTIWTKTYGYGNNDRGYCIQKTNDNGYIICGETWYYGANYSDVYLIKVDSLGDTLWTRIYNKYPSEAEHSGKCVEVTSDSGFIITGYCQAYAYRSDPNLYLIKTDSIGDTLWTRVYGGIESDYGFSVKQAIDRGYIIAGQTYSFGNYSQAYLIKTDTLGNVAVEERKDIRPQIRDIRLFVHPNPFTEKTVISYQLPVISEHSQLITDYRLP